MIARLRNGLGTRLTTGASQLSLEAIATGTLLALVCHMSPAVARSSPGNGDHPWNPEHIDRLPLEVRNAIGRLCGPSLRAGHYFATFPKNPAS
jgi:hypothetical protein